MKQISIGKQVYHKLEAAAKQRGFTIDEYVAWIIKEQAREKPEASEEVTVKVPKNLMRLIEDQHYFGRSSSEFFAQCIKRGVDCELNKLDLDEMRRLERKYNFKCEGIIDLSKSTL